MDIKKIFKYPLHPQTGVIELPAGAKILSVTSQGEEIVLYALVNPAIKVTKDVLIKVIGTGHTIHAEGLTDFTYLGTVKLLSDQLIFHVFYRDLGYNG